MAETLALSGTTRRRAAVARRWTPTRTSSLIDRTADVILLSREAIANGLDRRGSTGPSGSGGGRTSSTRRAWSCSAGRSSMPPTARRAEAVARRGMTSCRRCVSYASGGPSRRGVRARPGPRRRTASSLVERATAARRARRPAERSGHAGGAPTAHAGEIVALGLLHEVGHALVDRYERDVEAGALRRRAAGELDEMIGTQAGRRRSSARFAKEFGPEPGEARPASRIAPARSTSPPRTPPTTPIHAARRPRARREGEGRTRRVTSAAIESLLGDAEAPDGSGESLVEMLRAPARHSPDVARRPAPLRPRALGLRSCPAGPRRAARSPGDRTSSPRRSGRSTSGSVAAVAAGRRRRRRSPAPTPSPSGSRDDRDWMPRLVLAREEHVRLARPALAPLRPRDPDARRDPRRGAGRARPARDHRALADRAVAALAGVGDDQALARQPGGGRVAPTRSTTTGSPTTSAARPPSRSSATGPRRRGIRLASDMVPNHMGIDSRWVDRASRAVHLGRRAAVPGVHVRAARTSPTTTAVEIRIEDHYWDDSDAAVVFERRDTRDRRAALRLPRQRRHELPVERHRPARLPPGRRPRGRDPDDPRRRPALPGDPLRRRDGPREEAHRAAVVPGAGPRRRRSRRAAEHAMSKAEFERLMPHEFWREVVDRVAAEAPDTLLLAEAFWLLEGYFVRTLGMHRVYNSAFMHMLRDEDNAGYRKVIRDTRRVRPRRSSERYVNFLTNPDEETAIEQFGTGDKYFGAATLLATLPGLPMIGHGQVEGFTEKYGMEFRRARLDEQPNDGPRSPTSSGQIVPLLRERRRFAGSADFRLYDVVGRRRGARRGRLRLLERARRRPLADRLPQPVRRRPPAGSGTPCRSLTKADDGSKTTGAITLARRSAAPARRRLASRVPRRAGPGWSTCGPVGELRERGLFVELDAVRVPRLRRVPRGSLDRGRAVGGAGRRARRARRRLARRRAGRPPAAAGPRSGRGGARPRPIRRRSRWPWRTSSTGLDRPRFDELRLATPLRRAGLDDGAIRRTRLAIGLAHPATTPDAATLAAALAGRRRGPRLPRGPRLGRRDVPERRPLDRARRARRGAGQGGGRPPGVAGDRPAACRGARRRLSVGSDCRRPALGRTDAVGYAEATRRSLGRAAPALRDRPSQSRTSRRSSVDRRRAVRDHVLEVRPVDEARASRRSRRRPAAPAPRRRRADRPTPRRAPAAGLALEVPDLHRPDEVRARAGSTRAGPGRTSRAPRPPPGTRRRPSARPPRPRSCPAAWIPTSISAFATHRR